VEYAYDLARALADEIERRAGFELLLRPESDIVCCRRRADAGAEADALQIERREAVHRGGRFFIMRTTIAAATWLRVVLMDPATGVSQLRRLLDELQ
jgi:L-2,4-diaminobutyrate decarboxylase